MSYFELKPQNRPYFNGDVDKYMSELVFTSPRDQVPIAMDGRVPAHVWAETYDELEYWYRNKFEAFSMHKRSPLMFLMILPCFLLCTVPYGFKRMREMSRKQKEMEMDLAKLIQQQNAIYRKYGVQVSAAKELVSRGVGSDRYMDYQVVGLRFDVVGGPAMAPPQATPFIPVPMYGYNGHNAMMTGNANMGNNHMNVGMNMGAGHGAAPIF